MEGCHLHEFDVFRDRLHLQLVFLALREEVFLDFCLERLSPIEATSFETFHRIRFVCDGQLDSNRRFENMHPPPYAPRESYAEPGSSKVHLFKINVE